MLSNNQKIALFTSMLRIRKVEERIDAEYLQDQMRTPIHLCIGQEAIAVGVCAALDDEDTISSNHRGHGHYLAKGGDLKAFIAELFCRSTGCSGAFGGSMHLVDPNIGHLGSSSIVGGGIPIGTGHALAFALKKTKQVSVVFLGDGASEEGVFYESMNFAVLKKLPVIFVLENNQIAICSPYSNRQPCDSIFHRAYSPDLLFTAKVDGNDTEAVYILAKQAVDRARRGEGPSFIDARTFRFIGHMGCASQDVTGYRDESEVQAWHEKCPIKQYTHKLLDKNVCHQNDIEQIFNEVSAEIEEAFQFAQQSTLPDPSEAATLVYCE